jgi:putative protease
MSHIDFLLSRSYEALRAAIKAGCDAVYFNVVGFNMRANASAAFTIEDLREIAKICHEANVKCYLALNTRLRQFRQ